MVMDGQLHFNASIYVATLVQELRKDGFIIEVDDKFDAFEEACRDENLGKPWITPPFNPDFIDIDPMNLLWVKATSEDRIVAVEGMRFEHISVPLSKHLDQQYRRIFCDPTPGSGLSGHAPAVNQVTGRTAYHGDLYIHPAHREGGLATKLSRLLIALAVLKWDPEYIWGYITEKLVNAGYGIQIGYHHVQPAAIHWVGNIPENRSLTDCFVWSTKEDLNYMISCGVSQRHTEPTAPLNVSDKVEADGCIVVQ
jgi:hypothetical protein